jgi:hypothetical protein
MGEQGLESCFVPCVVCHYLVQTTELARREEMLHRQISEALAVCSKIQMGWLDEAVVGREFVQRRQRPAWIECGS